MDVNNLSSFVGTKGAGSKKTAFEAIKDILTFFLELVLTVVPMFVLGVIFWSIKDMEFPWNDIVIDGELLWFSITTFVFLLVKIFFSDKNENTILKFLCVIISILLLALDGFFIFLKLTVFDVATVNLDTTVATKITIASVVVTSIIYSTFIILRKGNE